MYCYPSAPSDLCCTRYLYSLTIYDTYIGHALADAEEDATEVKEERIAEEGWMVVNDETTPEVV